MTRTPAQAIQVMKDRDARNETGWQGLCLKSCRTAYDLPGGWSEADVWWDSCPDEYKHPWSDAPPFGMPIYWRIGEYGHIALSNGDGTIYGTDLPTNDQIGHCSIDLPRTKWGAKPVGWANWLNGQVLPYDGNTVPNDPGEPTQGDAGMDYAEIAAKQKQTVDGTWRTLILNDEIRDSAGIHYKDGTFSFASRRFELNPSLTMEAAVETNLAIRAVVLDGENIIQAYPATSFKAGPGELANVSVSLPGYCPKDRRVRIQVKTYGASLKVTPYVVARTWV
jgi:hypothetical protein